MIEYNMRNIFIEKSFRKCPNTFYKKIKIEYISGLTVRDATKVAFMACLRPGLPKYIKTKVLTN